MARLIVLAALLAASASAQTYSGRLAPGDETLGSGEFVDEYAVQARRGEAVRAVVTSADFDTYVIVKSGSGEQSDNDDCTEGETTRSCADFVADRDGRVRILVTSFAAGEAGAYEVEITVGASAPAGEPGRLEDGDLRLPSGEFYDRRGMRLEAGQTVSVSLASTGFDAYLILRAPDGTQHENDDCAPETRDACLALAADQPGEWEILVTSYAAGETGAYTLAVETGEPEAPARAPAGGPDVRTERGALSRGDDTLPSGEFADDYEVVGTGGPLVVDLRSDAFDPYLVVETRGGERFDNDDHEGALDRSLLVVQTREGERYTVRVTSFAPGETGPYTLDLRAEDAASGAGVRTESGTLGPGDPTLEAGEYADRYTFDGVPGQRLRADLTSDDFDTYLVLQTPTGEVRSDDDGGGRLGHSRLDLDLTEPGTYSVLATSYASGETGAYRLALDLTERFGQAEGPGGGSSQVFSTPSASRLGLDMDETRTGALDDSDQRLATGEFMEVHTFDGEAGEPVRVEMTSDAFDTYLIVESPSGARLENDDDGGTSRSAVEFVMPEAGRYRVLATSYRAGETGPYQIRLNQAGALVPEPPAYDTILGLFVGIGDYDRMGDLQWTAHDAAVARDAMVRAGMDPADGILLTDREATVAGVRDAARRLAARADDRTLLVFFYSGHGGQYARSSFQREDPDGRDESIELFDAPLLDDDLDALLASVPSARQLVVLDACFSGGFAKDVVSRPGRMGLFSSEEDIVSAVAVKFEAGGYLSRFFADAVAEQQADEDRNGAVTALELSHYLDERYVEDVRSEADPRALLGGHDTRAEHQKLVVDRGSIGLYESLFLLRP